MDHRNTRLVVAVAHCDIRLLLEALEGNCCIVQQQEVDPSRKILVEVQTQGLDVQQRGSVDHQHNLFDLLDLDHFCDLHARAHHQKTDRSWWRALL